MIYYLQCVFSGAFYFISANWKYIAIASLQSHIVICCSTSFVFFRKTLQIAKELSDKALEAQACYSLGNTYTLLRDFEQAIEYHVRHLNIAKELNDKVGEGRACWSLGNAHTSLGNHEQAMQFAARHLEISKEVLF